MTEQNNTKKPGPAKCFFRWLFTAVKWLFVVLLSLLLIAGLYFKAPPKVLALIAIILTTLTTIPKRTRKWIWLTFAIIIIALVVWVFLPEDDGDWRPYTFDEELAALEAKRTIPDDQNAATIYNKLLEIYDSNEFSPYPDFMDDELDNLTANEPWSTKDHPQLAKWFENCQDVIATLMQVSEKDTCQFSSSVDPVTLRRSSDRLNAIKRGARLLIRSANNDLGDGHIEDAIKKQIAVIRIVQHLYQQPSLINTLVGIAFEARSHEWSGRLIVEGNLTKTQLNLIEKTMRGIAPPRSTNRPVVLAYDRLTFMYKIRNFYDINSEGKTRLSRDPSFALRAGFPKDIQEHFRTELRWPEFPLLPYWKRKCVKAATILWWFCLPSTPQKALEIIDSVYQKISAMPEPIFIWGKSSPKIDRASIKFNYAGMLEFAWRTGQEYERIHDLYLRAVASRRATLILMAIRLSKDKHALWPQSLEELKSLAPLELFVDPTNKDSFVYRLTEEGFTLYSKGKNNIDENGDRRTKKPDGTRTDDLLIWPPKSHKNIEANQS